MLLENYFSALPSKWESKNLTQFEAPIPHLYSNVHTPHEAYLRSLLTRLQRLDALRTRSASKQAYRINFKTPIY